MEPFVAARAVPEIRLLAGVLDGFDLFWRVPLDSGEVRELELRKLESQMVGRGKKGKGKRPWLKYGEELLEVAPNDARIGPLLLENEHMSVVLNPAPLENMPSVMISLKAFLVCQVGADRAEELAMGVVGELAADQADEDQLEALTTGVDLALDFQGWQPTLRQLMPRRKSKQMEGFVNEKLFTRATKMKVHLDKRFEGMDYGLKSSGISAAFYNKTLEIEEASNKTWFEEIWKRSGNYRPPQVVNGEVVREDVWRLEFRMKRDGLTEFMREGGIENFSKWKDVKKHLDGLWIYLTTKWLVMRGKRSKANRLANAIDPFWQQFVDGAVLFQTSKASPTVLRRKLHRVAVRCFGAAAGYFVQLHACEQYDERNFRRTFSQSEGAILAGIRKYMHDHRWDPEEKARRYIREWTSMEHLGLMGEDVLEEAEATG